MTTETQDREHDYYVELMLEKQYEADRARCESFPEGHECDFCTRIVCTKDGNCICPKCLDLPF